jgi:cell division transport system permease protein
MRLRFVFSELAIGLRKNLLMLFAVVIITAFSMLFLGLALLLQREVGLIKHSFYQKLQVSVYLCGSFSENPACPTPVTEAQISDIQNTLLGLRPTVTSVQFVDQQQAYQIFKTLFKDNPDLVKSTLPSTLPESFIVKLSDPHKFDVIASSLAGKPGVDEVQNENSFLKTLFKVMNAIRNAALFACVLAIAAAGILIGIAVKVAADGRRREIGIMRLVGAANLYIRLPFLLEGVVAGVSGAVLGFGGVTLVKSILVDGHLKPVVAVLGGALVGWSDVFSTLPWLVGFGAAVAAVASYVTLRAYLRV